MRRVRGAAGEAAPAGISWVPLERWTDAIARGDVRDAVTIAAWRLLADAALPGDARARRRPAAAGPPPRAADVTTDDFLDAPLSELAFIERVLALAEDARVPLLERIRYLAIVSANLDEFYMERPAASATPPARPTIAKWFGCRMPCRHCSPGRRPRSPAVWPISRRAA